MALRIEGIEKGIKRTDMKVERFDTVYRPYSKGMIKDNLGSYVKYSDYEKLESQIKENNKLYSSSFLMWITGIKELSVLKKKYGEYKNQIEKLKGELKELK